MEAVGAADAWERLLAAALCVLWHGLLVVVICSSVRRACGVVASRAEMLAAAATLPFRAARTWAARRAARAALSPREGSDLFEWACRRRAVATERREARLVLCRRAPCALDLGREIDAFLGDGRAAGAPPRARRGLRKALRALVAPPESDAAARVLVWLAAFLCGVGYSALQVLGGYCAAKWVLQAGKAVLETSDWLEAWIAL